MKKIIFFDIDDTLYDKEKRLPESTRRAIAELQGAGHTVAIATGRSPMMFNDLRRTLHIDTYVSMNGQFVVANGNVVYENPLASDKLASLVRDVDTDVAPMMYLNHEVFASQVEAHPHYEQALGTLKLPFGYTYEPDAYQTMRVFQALIFADEVHSKPYIERFKDDFDFVRWHDLCIDVLPKKASKAEGIEKLLAHLGVDIKDTIAFGDGPNDHEMLKAVGVGVAMGNASDALKEDADMVTSNVDRDGVFEGLVRLKLIKGE